MIKDEYEAIKLTGTSSDEDLEIYKKIEYLRKLEENLKLKKYIQYRLKHLTLCNGSERRNAIDMMKNDYLVGYCYVSSYSIIPFFENNDILIKGNLNSDNYSLEHSWLNIAYHRNEYVLDPALNILVSKCFYDDVFQTEEISKIKSGIIKNIIIDKMKNEVPDFLCGRVTVQSSDQIEDPFYCQNAYIKGIVKGKKIKKMDVYFDHDM